jgi:hypothetical protein
LQSRSAGSGHYIDALFTVIVQQINEFWLIPIGRLELYRFATSAILEVFTTLVLRIQGFFVVKLSKKEDVKQSHYRPGQVLMVPGS